MPESKAGIFPDQAAGNLSPIFTQNLININPWSNLEHQNLSELGERDLCM